MFLIVAFEDFTAACKHKFYLNRITLRTFDICCVSKCISVKQNFGKRRTVLPPPRDDIVCHICHVLSPACSKCHYMSQHDKVTSNDRGTG